MDTPTNPNQSAYERALVDAYRDRTLTLADAVNNIRTWRQTVPHTAAVQLAPLDAILDALALGDDVPLLQIEQPTSLQEAVTAYRAVLDARRTAIATTRLVWDQVEASAIREMDRHMTAQNQADRPPLG